LANDAAIVVRNQDELETFVRRCLADGDFAADLGRRARQLVIEQQGAADRTLALLENLLPPSGARQGRAA
jgi:3-deoxy-D-manno-octulosonic-acid transferase